MTFISSEKAVSEVIGQVLVLGLTVTGIAMISLVGLPTIYSMQDMATVGNAEQAFTVMDSRISAVALGNTPIQLIDINLGGGTLAIESNDADSYIEVNITGESADTLTVPMGKVKYQLGERTVAYEGGGVWSKYPSGGSVMLSPPEFHYNGVTLTLPVINIAGNGSTGGSGSVTLRLKKNGNPDIKYPNASNGRTNPVNGSGNGTVYVNITSDFYDAWADYARSLGYTIVNEDADNNKVSIELTVVPTTLGMNTSITNPVVFRGLDASNPAPLESWSFRLENVDSDFNWQLTATLGGKTLIYYLKKSGGSGNNLDLTIGYKDMDFGYPESDSAEIWTENNAFPVTDSTAIVDLLNQSVFMTYNDENVGVNNGGCNRIDKSNFNTTKFTWSVGDNQSLYNITQHYIWKMTQVGDVSFNGCIPSNGHGEQGPDPGTSTMLINYTSVGALTYLHISDNVAVVDIV